MTDSKVEDYIEAVASKPGNDDPVALWPSLLRAMKPHSDNAYARQLILRRMKEALLKGTMLFGIPRALNVFYPLAKIITDADSIDREVVRESVKNPLDLTDRGLKYFENIYREDSAAFLEPYDKLFPDLRVLAVHLEYGMYMSETKILSPIETSMTTIASLLPMDVPTQVRWHMKGLLRNNGSVEQIAETLRVAKGAIDVSGIVLKGDVPNVSDVTKDSLL